MQSDVRSAPSRRAQAEPTDPKGPTGTLSRWVVDTKLDDIPVGVRNHALTIMLDGVGCGLVGAQLPWSRLGVAAVTGLDGGGSHVVVGHDLRTSGPSAAMLNGSFIQGFELDDYFPDAAWHASAALLPALLAASEQHKTSGAEFLRAMVLGMETGSRVGRALRGPQMISRGWHPGAVFGGPAAAVAAGTIYGLDAGTVEDALGMAATQACGLMSAQFESMVKRMQHGFAARNGLTAAALAANGYVGIKRVFEREMGMLAVFGEGHDPVVHAISDGLGERWDTSAFAVKPYSAQAMTHGAVDAARAVRAQLTNTQGSNQRSLDVNAIDAVEVHVGKTAYDHGAFPIKRPLSATSAQMSLRYTVAVTLLEGTALLAQYRTSRLDDDTTWAVIDRLKITHDQAFDEPSHMYGGRVRVRTTDGTTYDHGVASPTGGPEHLLSREQVTNKFQTITADVIDSDRVQQIEDLVLHLDEHHDGPTHLVALLAPVVRGAMDD